MDDEINKTSHENITHLAANTLYFLPKFIFPNVRRLQKQLSDIEMSHNMRYIDRPDKKFFNE